MTRGALAVLVAEVAAEVVALAAAWRAARPRALRSPLVLLCALGIVSDLAIEAGRALLLGAAPRPFVGGARAWYSVETAIVLAWPCALWIAAWRVLTSPHDPWREPAICSAIGAWMGLSVGLAAAYPLTGGEVAAALLCVEGAAVCAGWLAYARGRRARIGGRRRATVIEVAVLALVAVETAVVLIGPWARNPFADWHLARASYFVGFTFVALLHVQRVRARLGL